MKIKKYLIIIIVLGISYQAVVFMTKNIFIANSPKINPYFMSNITNKLRSQYIAFISKFNTANNLNSLKNYQNLVFAPISKNVSAAYDNKGTYIKVDFQDENYISYNFKLSNGKEVNLKVLKGQNPPDQHAVEDLYK